MIHFVEPFFETTEHLCPCSAKLSFFVSLVLYLKAGDDLFNKAISEKHLVLNVCALIVFCIEIVSSKMLGVDIY